MLNHLRQTKFIDIIELTDEEMRLIQHVRSMEFGDVMVRIHEKRIVEYTIKPSQKEIVKTDQRSSTS